VKAKTKIVPIGEIKPHPRNPNGHSAEQVGLLAKSAKKYEQVRNIVVWQGLIIAGEGFWRGAKKAGLKEIEVKDVSHWPEAKALAYMYDDNALAFKSELDAAGVLLLIELAEQDGESPTCLTDDERGAMVKQAKLAKREQVKLANDPGALMGAPAAQVPSSDNGKARFPLAVILDGPTNRAWQEYKGRVGKKQDTAAFVEMFEAVTRADPGEKPGSEIKSG